LKDKKHELDLLCEKKSQLKDDKPLSNNLIL